VLIASGRAAPKLGGLPDGTLFIGKPVHPETLVRLSRAFSDLCAVDPPSVAPSRCGSATILGGQLEHKPGARSGILPLQTATELSGQAGDQPHAEAPGAGWIEV